jgi:hypothetical protein
MVLVRERLKGPEAKGVTYLGRLGKWLTSFAMGSLDEAGKNQPSNEEEGEWGDP